MKDTNQKSLSDFLKGGQSLPGRRPKRVKRGRSIPSIRSRRAYYRGDFQKVSKAAKDIINVCPECGEGPLGREFLRAYYVIQPESIRWEKSSWEEHSCYGLTVRRPWDTEENIKVLCMMCYDALRACKRQAPTQ